MNTLYSIKETTECCDICGVPQTEDYTSCKEMHSFINFTVSEIKMALEEARGGKYLPSLKHIINPKLVGYCNQMGAYGTSILYAISSVTNLYDTRGYRYNGEIDNKDVYRRRTEENTKAFIAQMNGLVQSENYGDQEFALSHVQSHEMDENALNLLITHTSGECWIDLLCKEEFHPSKCGRQYLNRKVLVYDKLIYEASTIAELQVYILFSDWCSRGWIKQEYARSKEIHVMTRYGIIILKQFNDRSHLSYYLALAPFIVIEDGIVKGVIVIPGLFDYHQTEDYWPTVSQLIECEWTYPEDLIRVINTFHNTNYETFAEMCTETGVLWKLLTGIKKIKLPGLCWGGRITLLSSQEISQHAVKGVVMQQDNSIISTCSEEINIYKMRLKHLTALSDMDKNFICKYADTKEVVMHKIDLDNLTCVVLLINKKISKRHYHVIDKHVIPKAATILGVRWYKTQKLHEVQYAGDGDYLWNFYCKNDTKRNIEW